MILIFIFFLLKKKMDLLSLGLDLGLWMKCRYHQIYLDKIQFRASFQNRFRLFGSILY